MSLLTGQKILYLGYPILLCAFLINKKPIKLHVVSKCLLAIFFIIFFSSLAKLDFLDFRVLITHLRFLSYFIVFTAAYNIALGINLSLSRLRKVLILLSLLILLFILLQLLFPEIMIGTGITNNTSLGRHGTRIAGPLVWPYSYSFVMLPVFSIILASLIYGVGGIGLLLLMSLIITSVFFTQSKSAYIAYSLSTLILFLSIFKQRGSKYGWLIFFFITIFSTIFIIYISTNLENFGNINRFIVSLSEDTFDASTQARLDQIAHVGITVNENLIFGYPIIDIDIENAYGWYFYNFGLIGLISYLIILTILFSCAVKAFKFSGQPEIFLPHDQSMVVGYLVLVVGCWIFSLANAPIDGHKVSYFFWVVSGFFFGGLKNKSLTSFS